MASELSMQCNLVYRFLKYALPQDTIDVDLKGCTLKVLKNDYTVPNLYRLMHGE